LALSFEEEVELKDFIKSSEYFASFKPDSNIIYLSDLSFCWLC